jgi:hypothetical protein
LPFSSAASIARVFLRLLLLRADQQEIEDHEDRHHRQHRGQQVAAAGGGGGLGVSGRDQHGRMLRVGGAVINAPALGRRIPWTGGGGME